MNRLSRSSRAFTVILALTVTVLTGAIRAEAAPGPLHAGSIDVSTTGIDCHATFPSSRDRSGATLTAGARTANLSVASMAQHAGDTDGLPITATTARANWSTTCATRGQHPPVTVAA